MSNPKTIPFLYLLDSQESLLLENLAKLGTNFSKDYDRTVQTGDPKYLEKFVLKKLFRTPENSEDTKQYLKNKYLYYLTGGTLGYLEAIQSMDYDTEVRTEVEGITTLLNNIQENGIKLKLSDFDLVSVGCGEGSKDTKIINQLFKDSKEFNYFPIDISPTLLQLTTIKFYRDCLNDYRTKWKIHPINGDFFNLSKADLKSKMLNRRKIFTLLGGTIGNYKEDDLVNEIKEIMNEQDLLLLSFETYKNEKQLNDKINEYFTSGNVEFLSNPISLIPKLSGYLSNKTKYFKLYGSGFEERTDAESIFTDSKVYRPKLTIPDLDSEYVIAWTTRYKQQDLLNNIEAKIKMTKIKHTSVRDTLFILLKKDQKEEVIIQTTIK